ncbi:hypothetical protein TNCV_2950721 [Trichonephila clavipes]|nr:hypothetical protein TNCV_2950721 [Trichonephila clavipes]
MEERKEGGLTAPKRVRGAPKTQWEWKMLLDFFFFFFAAGVKNGRSLQGKLADGTVVEIEAGASFYTDPISDEDAGLDCDKLQGIMYVYSPGSSTMREKGGNRLVQGTDYMVDALKLPNQAPRVSGESLQTCVA